MCNCMPPLPSGFLLTLREHRSGPQKILDILPVGILWILFSYLRLWSIHSRYFVSYKYVIKVHGEGIEEKERKCPGTMAGVGSTLKLSPRAVQQSKLLPGGNTTSHFWRPRADTKPHFNGYRANEHMSIWKNCDRTDSNLKMRPSADKKNWKMRLKVDKNFEKWAIKVSDHPSPSLRGAPGGKWVNVQSLKKKRKARD